VSTCSDARYGYAARIVSAPSNSEKGEDQPRRGRAFTTL
jgi:hypothetical protein